MFFGDGIYFYLISFMYDNEHLGTSLVQLVSMCNTTGLLTAVFRCSVAQF